VLLTYQLLAGQEAAPEGKDKRMDRSDGNGYMILFRSS